MIQPRLLLAAATCLLFGASLVAAAADPPRIRPARRALGQQLPRPGNGHVKDPDLTVIPRLLIRPTCSAMTTSGEVLNVTLGSPLPGDTTSSYEPDCPTVVEVSGTAGVGLLLSDFYFVIDSSGSTGRCTGSDIDGDGITGTGALFGCSDPDDSVLGAEIKAVRDYVATLSPLVSRIAIIQFSMPTGTGGGSERQRIVTSLTSDFAVVGAALDEIMAFGAAGATDYGGALWLLMDEHLANGDPLARRQFAYFLSDGVPTYPEYPFGTEEQGDSDWALDQAELCAARGIRIDTFGVGFLPSITRDTTTPPRCVRPDGSLDVSTLECMALLTGGDFFESTNPADIVDRLKLSEPAGIESVTVFNDTLGASVVASRTPDGRFAADVPVLQGEINLLRVIVVAEDGTTCELETDFLSLCFAAGCNPLTQGYWHRQCMGLGLIMSGGVGNPPPHPDWEPQILLRLMYDVVDPQVAALGSPKDQTACEGLDANPQDDMCQKAIKQYTAVLMNMVGGRLGGSCLLDIPDIGLEDVDPGTARDAIAALIRQGLAGDPNACKAANDAADLINTGAAID